ncbi:hydrolase [Clostridium polyendosporum]|uniref:Hydrolase n=1 Tax=Clostridium polyendosporum TaxID=69208 RepID=A0A919VFB5_9CLOT|nr:HAD-IA family hydrolase [Clostridium polyendosporum]GIM30104.1 hydrolase [Clostridium polyendosporum]
MFNFEKYDTIIFDFDGVIIDSMPIRESGFRNIFSKFDESAVEELVKYHNLNGGLSRFHKIRYFYEQILNMDIDDNMVKSYAEDFTTMMREELSNPQYLIEEIVEFIRRNKDIKSLHIASGSEHEELNYLCKKLGIDNCFKSIDGSPTHKNYIVKKIIELNGYDKSKTVIIGDSINDYDAAIFNGIDFIGYNNVDLKNLPGAYYLDTFA